jgi:hypothetical protein
MAAAATAGISRTSAVAATAAGNKSSEFRFFLSYDITPDRTYCSIMLCYASLMHR